MKFPADRRLSDVPHYAPYPPISSPHQFQPPPPPSSSRSNGVSRRDSTADRQDSLNTLDLASASADDGGAPQYKVARAISSCTRCRQRKQKCDGKLPACSACERAKVECIGFDAISKTNVSRNYLFSLEQEVASLRAQVAALTSDDGIGQSKRNIASNASIAIAGYRPELTIDPALQHEGESPSSPWDSPVFQGGRRPSDFPTPSVPGVQEPSRPGYVPSRLGSVSAPTSLTRMVHDAALRTGHANDHISVQIPRGSTSATGSVSDKGSHGSPAGHDTTDGPSPDLLTPRSATNGIRRPPSVSPFSGASSLQTKGRTQRREFAVPPLPPQAAVERLVAAYVDFIGVSAPIIHIPSLGKQLIKIREGTNVEESDVFVVMMVLALSTMASSRFVDSPDELRACSEAFHAEAMKHLDAVFEEQTYVGLQAILLLVWYSLLNPDKGSVWFLVGLASRTCVDLGFHNEHNVQGNQSDALELDMRRRLFWVTYKVDRLLSQSLGRPPSIPDGFVNVPLPSPLHDVDIHPGQYGQPTGEPCSYKAVFIHTIKLRLLQSEILTYTYGVHGSDTMPGEEWFDDCYERMKEWLATAPEPRGTATSEGNAISFHNSALLLYRPSIAFPRPGRKALATVLASSSYIIRIYRRMQLNNRVSWLWMTSHYTFMAGLSFLYAFFNLYSTGGGPGGVPSLDDAMMDIESCLAVLEYLTSRVPSAGACHDTMQTVSKAILAQIRGQNGSQAGTGSPPGILGRTPVSSSRDDPLPTEAFPAPLPAVPLPYELSLLDNLFINPMAAHGKASDYMDGNKNRQVKIANRMAAKLQMPETSQTWGPAPYGLPPNAFHTGNFNGLGPYGMAAQVGMAAGVFPNPSVSVDPNGSFSGIQQSNGEDPNGGFDVFNFLMDEEGGLGSTGNWDALEVPADFSLWS